jgi:hypothetical protein
LRWRGAGPEILVAEGIEAEDPLTVGDHLRGMRKDARVDSPVPSEVVVGKGAAAREHRERGIHQRDFVEHAFPPPPPAAR